MENSRETDVLTLGELFEFLGRNFPLFRGDGFSISRAEFDALDAIVGRARAHINLYEMQVLDYLIYALYRDTFIDDNAVDHYGDGVVTNETIVIDTASLAELLVHIFVGLTTMKDEMCVRELNITRTDMDNIRKVVRSVYQFLNAANQLKLDQIMSKMVKDNNENEEEG